MGFDRDPDDTYSIRTHNFGPELLDMGYVRVICNLQTERYMRSHLIV